MSSSNNIEISVPGYEVRGHVTYTISVKKGETSWMVRRRYQDFVELNNAIRRAGQGLTGIVLPELPPKRVRLGMSKFAPEFLEERRAGLELYLQNVLKLPFSIGDPEWFEPLDSFLVYGSHWLLEAVDRLSGVQELQGVVRLLRQAAEAATNPSGTTRERPGAAQESGSDAEDGINTSLNDSNASVKQSVTFENLLSEILLTLRQYYNMKRSSLEDMVEQSRAASSSSVALRDQLHALESNRQTLVSEINATRAQKVRVRQKEKEHLLFILSQSDTVEAELYRVQHEVDALKYLHSTHLRVFEEMRALLTGWEKGNVTFPVSATGNSKEATAPMAPPTPTHATAIGRLLLEHGSPSSSFVISPRHVRSKSLDTSQDIKARKSIPPSAQMLLTVAVCHSLCQTFRLATHELSAEALKRENMFAYCDWMQELDQFHQQVQERERLMKKRKEEEERKRKVELQKKAQEEERKWRERKAKAKIRSESSQMSSSKSLTEDPKATRSQSTHEHDHKGAKSKKKSEGKRGSTGPFWRQNKQKGKHAESGSVDYAEDSDAFDEEIDGYTSHGSHEELAANFIAGGGAGKRNSASYDTKSPDIEGIRSRNSSETSASTIDKSSLDSLVDVDKGDTRIRADEVNTTINTSDNIPESSREPRDHGTVVQSVSKREPILPEGFSVPNTSAHTLRFFAQIGDAFGQSVSATGESTGGGGEGTRSQGFLSSDFGTADATELTPMHSVFEKPLPVFCFDPEKLMESAEQQKHTTSVARIPFKAIQAGTPDPSGASTNSESETGKSNTPYTQDSRSSTSAISYSPGTGEDSSSMVPPPPPPPSSVAASSDSSLSGEEAHSAPVVPPALGKVQHANQVLATLLPATGVSCGGPNLHSLLFLQSILADTSELCTLYAKVCTGDVQRLVTPPMASAAQSSGLGLAVTGALSSSSVKPNDRNIHLMLSKQSSVTPSGSDYASKLPFHATDDTVPQSSSRILSSQQAFTPSSSVHPSNTTLPNSLNKSLSSTSQPNAPSQASTAASSPDIGSGLSSQRGQFKEQETAGYVPQAPAQASTNPFGPGVSSAAPPYLSTSAHKKLESDNQSSEPTRNVGNPFAGVSATGATSAQSSRAPSRTASPLLGPIGALDSGYTSGSGGGIDRASSAMAAKPKASTNPFGPSSVTNTTPASTPQDEEPSAVSPPVTRSSGAGNPFGPAAVGGGRNDSRATKGHDSGYMAKSRGNPF